MPSFNSVNIFGRSVTMMTVDNPRADQKNSFFGLSGEEVLDAGLRGRYTQVSGQLWGTSAGNLNFALNLFRSYNDGNLYILVDAYLNAWPYVKLETFELSDRVKIDMCTGNYFQAYTARFRHFA